MRVLYDADDVSEGVGDGRDLDSFTHIMRGFDDFGAARSGVCQRFVDVRDSPPRDGSTGTDVFCIRVEAKLVTSDIEADVEWLIEIRLDAEHLRVPFLCAREIRRGVDDRAKSEKKAWIVHAGPA